MEVEFPIDTAADDVYEVEKIINKRYTNAGVKYLVKWRNFPNSANTWEPLYNFPRKLVEIYESTLNKRRQKEKKEKRTQKQKEKQKLKQPPREMPSKKSLDKASTNYLLPSSSTSSLTSSCSSSTIIITASTSTSQTQRRRGRPRRPSMLFVPYDGMPEEEAQRIQKEEMVRYGLSVFNPVIDHTKPVVDELVYELTKDPIIVTDITAKDLTVTISECKTPEGFFKGSLELHEPDTE